MTEMRAPGWYANAEGDQQWWDGENWGPVFDPQEKPHSERLSVDKGALLKWGCWAVIIGGLIAVIAFQNSPAKQAEREAERMYENAPVYAEMGCKDQVEARLKAPSTAKFSDVSVKGIGGEFTVTGSVDSENSFGAMIRSEFSCDVEVDGDLTTTSNVVIN